MATFWFNRSSTLPTVRVDAFEMAQIEDFAVELRRVADDGNFAGDVRAWGEIKKAQPKQIVSRPLGHELLWAIICMLENMRIGFEEQATSL